ncbi:MmgE/PrpD family protein [Rhodococcus sp. 06-418-5]|uniref:MmgE/PrpD family protein n=1 Tax=Rhodococcus sp. 06-418-5 TaxID=2022507 RepID=UPI000B9A42EB|nr:MmgE/PrpD family protein [Rhodococcus sp. 06-418-5]OZC81293.1 MmgE/PrpD family protein [Rhodococcus sp. 06-418-5]
MSTTPDLAENSEPATEPEGPTGLLSTWLANTTLADIPVHVLERAKHLMLDGVACALVGAQLPVSRLGVEAITRLDDSGSAFVIGWGGLTTSPPSAALLNSSFIQGFELDDFHPAAPLHSNAVVLPALFASIPPGTSITGARLLLGAVLGYEVGPRVGLALHGQEMLTRGWHSGAVFGPHAAAAAAGTLYGLDAAGFEDALGMAATQSSGLMSAQFESMVKRMQHGFAARNGLTAAALAASGYVGIKRVYEREYGGFLAVFGEGHQPDSARIGDKLGEFWETERIAVKPYAAMGALHGAIEAALYLRSHSSLEAGDIAHIDISVSAAAYHHGGWAATRPIETIGAQMNLAYTVAVAILDGAVLLEQFTDAKLESDDVWALIDRTDMRHDKDFDALPADEWLTTELKITLNDGTVLDKRVTHPHGTGDVPLTNDEIVQKYRTLTQPILDDDRRSAIERAVLALDTLDDSKELTDLLIPNVARALH